MGGLYATHLASEFPHTYKGVCLMAPAFGLYNPREMGSLLLGL